MMEAIVTLQSVRDPEIKDFQLIIGDSFSEICTIAFVGRNIASSWDIVDFESDAGCYDDLLPVCGEYYCATGRVI